MVPSARHQPMASTVRQTRWSRAGGIAARSGQCLRCSSFRARSDCGHPLRTAFPHRLKPVVGRRSGGWLRSRSDLVRGSIPTLGRTALFGWALSRCEGHVADKNYERRQNNCALHCTLHHCRSCSAAASALARSPPVSRSIRFASSCDRCVCF